MSNSAPQSSPDDGRVTYIGDDIILVEGGGDFTRRPISEAHRRDLEQRGLIPPRPSPPVNPPQQDGNQVEPPRVP